MKIYVQLKYVAVDLRNRGLSYSEIMKELNIPKSTLSFWLKGIHLSEQQNLNLKNRLKDKILRGRLQSSIALKARKIFKEKQAYENAEKSFKILSQDSFFILGIALYWAEGSKKSGYFQFVNSDPDMVLLMNQWIIKYLEIGKFSLKYRIFLNFPYKNENITDFWSKIVKVSIKEFQKTIYKPASNIMKKDPNYKGSLSIIITSIDILRQMMAWQKLLIKYYGNVLQV